MSPRLRLSALAVCRGTALRHTCPRRQCSGFKTFPSMRRLRIPGVRVSWHRVFITFKLSNHYFQTLQRNTVTSLPPSSASNIPPVTRHRHCPSTLPTPLSNALCVCVTWCVCVCARARVCHSILNSTLPPSSHPTKVLVFATLDTTSVVAGIPTGRTPNLGSFLF